MCDYKCKPEPAWKGRLGLLLVYGFVLFLYGLVIWYGPKIKDVLDRLGR